jgi:hypothetical protein
VRDLGVTTIRDGFANWADIEPKRGRGYRFEPFDDLVQKASDRGIEIVALVYPYPTWATGAKAVPLTEPLTPVRYELPKREFEGDFRRFVRAMVTRYCGQRPESLRLKVPVRHWILNNELDACPVSLDEYAVWLRILHEEVKAIDPGAKVMPMGFSTWRPDRSDTGTWRVKELLASRNLQGPGYPYFDILAYHSYPYDFINNLYIINVAEATARWCLSKHAVNTETWLMEAGSSNTDPTVQADQAIKVVVHAASTGISRVYLFTLWDYGDARTPQAWGVLAKAPWGQLPVRKPSFFAYQTLVRMIGQNRGVQFLGPGRYRAKLPDGKAVYIVWSEEPNTGKPDFLTGRIRGTDLRGTQQEIDANVLTINNHPQLIGPLQQAAERTNP